MAGAGLTGALGVSGSIDATGLSTSGLITAYAKQELIRASVNATLAATIDGQDFGEALKQGVAMMGVNTVASWAAGKIGDLYKIGAADRINYATHKALHGLLGGTMGAGLAAITHTDPRIGVLSGAVGSMIGEMVAEGFSPDKADIERYLAWCVRSPPFLPSLFLFHFCSCH